jgi:hypothetical protein
MTVPFGISVGDFIAGINLLRDAIKALDDAGGARADYTELRKCLGALETALNAASRFTTPLHQAAIQPIAADCKACIVNFLVKVAKFDLLNGEPTSPNKLRSGLRKVQWSLCEKEKVVEFRRHLNMHISALQLQLLVFNV